MKPERPNRFGVDHPAAHPDAPPASVSIAGRFRCAWAASGDSATASPELLPVRLARACQAVLPVDGAGLSLLNDDFRVPLGASDELAGLAERLQFTVGEGPCLIAGAEQRRLVSDAAQLEQRWPLYANELFSHTPYRVIVALPLALNANLRGAVDLFLTDPAGLDQLNLADALIVTEQILQTLIHAQHSTGPEDGAWSDDPEPAWLRSPAARDRTSVWVAVGVLMTRLDLSAPDALSLLRSYAYGRDAVLDDIAAEVMNGDLDVARLRP